MTGYAIATAADMPKLVGYKQLRELYGWPKRTIQEWIRARKFPKPLNLPGRDNYWALDDIISWLKGDLARVAVSRPEDLSLEEVEDTALALVVKSIENKTGKAVDPAKLSVHVTRELSWDEFVALEADEYRLLSAALANLSPGQAAFIAGTILPQLRATLTASPDEDIQKAFAGREMPMDSVRPLSEFLRLIGLTARQEA